MNPQDEGAEGLWGHFWKFSDDSYIPRVGKSQGSGLSIGRALGREEL
jgi:hypothetical protein